MPKERFTIHAGHWYSWQMLPGYLNSLSPYYSPIYVLGVHPLQNGTNSIQLHFVNSFYAAGVQDFNLILRVLYRGEEYLIADLNSQSRCAVVGEISDSWMTEHASQIIRNHPGYTPSEALTAWAHSDQYQLD